jgi:6-pyruvoyltetrahydropterin/6-carboxytetrahydropterin synthase
MHGHSYRLEVAIEGPLQTRGPATGMVEDFDVVDRVVRERAIVALDHYTLNDFIENPTAENIVLWIWDRLQPHLDGLTELILWETPSACAVLRRPVSP